MKALEEHLMVLENQRKHVDSLIWTVKQTLGSMKGECEMKDREKFQAFKEGLIRENEEKYGKEKIAEYINILNEERSKIIDMDNAEHVRREMAAVQNAGRRDKGCFERGSFGWS